LTTDGDGIIVTEPTIPGYLWQNPTDIQALVLDDDDICQRTMQTYKTIRTDMKKNRDDLRTHDVVYRFPPGVTCNNEFFNSQNRRSSQHELDTELCLYKQVLGLDQNGQPVVQFCPFIVWKMAIDGEGKQTEDDDDALNKTSKAFARLGIKVGTKPPERMDEDT
jgi:hypothetical protein